MENIIFYGTGKTAQRLLEKTRTIQTCRVIAIIDGNADKRNQLFYGFKIEMSADITKYDFDKLIIASVFHEEIRKRLEEEYPDMRNKIVTNAVKYLQGCWLKQEAARHYKNYARGESCFSGSGRVVVYTAIVGDYDELKEPDVIDERVHYVCYTDNPNLKSDIWEIRCMEDCAESDMCRKAKVFKILPHKFFAEYDWSIWVDGSFQITGSLLDVLKEKIGREKTAFCLHNVRNCAYAEAEACITYQKDLRTVIERQMNQYKKEGYPMENGLIFGGFIVRKHNDKEVIRLMETWYCEIERNSRRDQLSFNYAAWKSKINFDVLDIDFLDNKYFQLCSHKYN